MGARGDISVRWIGSGAGRAGRCCSRGTVRRARTSISLRESCKPCGWNCGWRRAMSGSDHAPRAGRIKLEMKIRRGKAVGVEGSGRGSTTYQAAAAAFVYDDHHGDVRVRRVIVVGLALVASLGFGQAEKRAHEPTHVVAGRATSTKFREKNREPLRGEPPSRGLERPSRGCRGGSRHSCGTGESANASFVRRTARGRVFAA